MAYPHKWLPISVIVSKEHHEFMHKMRENSKARYTLSVFTGRTAREHGCQK